MAHVVEEKEWENFIERNQGAVWITNKVKRTFREVEVSLGPDGRDLWWHILHSNRLRDIALLHNLVQ